ncbi:MAG: hypothetical protein ACTSU5_11460 [Promethearchaeota archaeon]
MGQFLFYFASQAYFDPLRGDGGAFPHRGVEDYGNLVHEFGIPVTWLTNARGAELGRDLFTKFHEDDGDEVILWCLPFQGADTGKKRDFVLEMSEGDVLEYVREEQAGLRAALPWARVDHCGFFYRTPAVVRALYKVGMKSVYGHCWEEFDTDGVTDAGAPWGFYYVDPDVCWKRPRPAFPSERGIVANEWLQHDLNKVWNYYGSSSVFSWDPNDVGRAGVCDGRQVDYWKAAFREYYKNREWNDFIPFVFHQEAHEQESTPGGWEVYDPATVANTAEMTAEFLAFLTSGEFPDLVVSTLPAAVEEYRRSFAHTNPTYMLFRDVPVSTPEWLRRREECLAVYEEAKREEEEAGETLDPERDYAKLKFLFPPSRYGWQGAIHADPFPESFVYYDTEVQLFFHEGRSRPVKAYNYTKEVDADLKNLYFNKYLFTDGDYAKVEVEVRGDTGSGFEVKFRAPKVLPYGLCLWGDFSGGRWKAEEVLHPSKLLFLKGLKVVDGRLAFARVNLVDGNSVLAIRKE